jgi:hypothetical protein
MCYQLGDADSSTNRVLFPARPEYKHTIDRLITLTMNSILGAPTEATGPNAQTPMGEGTADIDNPNLGQWLFGSAQRGSIGTKIWTSVEWVQSDSPSFV